jgi:hypothetical protein
MPRVSKLLQLPRRVFNLKHARQERMDKDFWKNAAKVVGVVALLSVVALLMYWLGRYRGPR